MQTRPKSNQQWKRQQEIFCAAAELPFAEQSALLDTECAGDPELRAEVESLLRADRASDVAVMAAIGGEAEVLIRDSLIVGARLGDYRVIRELGHGGMGTVYLAERDDQHYRKQVAIKVVKRGMDTADILGRFRYERQLLANLDHPYVARLIDGGSTPDGRPFFVMDYVQGRPIDDYCNSHHLDLDARLRLFLLVTEAVSEAHRNLIVHRDLKPGNILVTPDGIPKLLDFGVARLLEPGVDSVSPATAMSDMLVTPEYASPEQVRGLPVTTAIDVYALGAVLYELLTGVRAQHMASRTAAEVDRVVCQTAPARPSSVAPTQFRRQLAGDLDNIVRMAMHKEKDRRYASVDQLAEDIRRHLAGRPVRARGDSLRYRAWKYVGRHRWAIGALCLIAGTIITGAAVALSQARQAQAARQVAEAQRRAAEAQRLVADRERTRAEAEALAARKERDRSETRLTEMVELADRSLYDVHSAIERLPGSTEARQRIVASTLQFLENLSRDAGPDDRLKYVLSVAYGKVADTQGYPLLPNLGDRAGALANYSRALDWIAPLLAKEPENPPFLLQQVSMQAHMGSVLDWEGQKPRAIAIFRAALPNARKLARLRPRDSEYRMQEANLYSNMALSSVSNDRAQFLEFSRKEVESMLAVTRDFPSKREVKLELATAYSQLGQAMHADMTRSLAEIADAYRRSIALREDAVATNPNDAVARRGLMISYANLAGVLSSPVEPSLGDNAAAAVYYAKMVSIARELATADPNNRLAQYDLANALLREGLMDPPPAEREASLAELRQADELLGQALARDPKSLPTARNMSLTEEYIGHRLRDLGRLPEAIVSYRRSLELADRFLAVTPNDNPLLLEVLANENAIAMAMANQGDRTAPEMARKAIERATQWSASAPTLDRARSLLAAAYGNLAAVYQTLGDCALARDAAAKALAGWKALADSGGTNTTEPERVRAQQLLRSCAVTPQ